MESKFINDSNTTILTVGAGETISSVSMIFCNLDESQTITLDLFLLPQGEIITGTSQYQIVKSFEIPPTDTMLWSTERFIMTAGYQLIQKQSVTGKVTCNLSYLQL